MKNIFFLPVLLLLFASCTVDNEDLNLQEENFLSERLAQKGGKGGGTVSACFITLYASVQMDMSNGLNNPKVFFVSNPPNVNANNGYLVKVEIQALADCEDLNNGTGPVLTFSGAQPFYNVSANHPAIEVPRSQFPPCFRWRMVFEGYDVSIYGPGCLSYTQWYDGPVL